MATLKTTYNSSVMFCADNPNEKGEYPHLVFDLASAKAKFEGREVMINGQWCPLFLVTVSKSTCKVGATYRSQAVSPATAMRLAPPSAPKAPKTLASDLGVSEIESAEAAKDRECGLPTGN